jgi:hypothetical protein
MPTRNIKDVTLKTRAKRENKVMFERNNISILTCDHQRFRRREKRKQRQ